MITQREAKQIVDFVINELKKRQYSYTTDGRLDLSSSSVGGVGGTPITGGQIKINSIYDRHVNTNADIRGTKVRVATISERGTVELAQPTETASGIVVQANDYRLHDGVVSSSTQHDARYRTKDELSSVSHDYGASLIGVEDPSGYFIGQNVESALYELFDLLQDAIVGSGIPIHGNDAHEPDFAYDSVVSGISESVDELNQAQAAKRIMYIKAVAADQPLYAEDGKTYVTVPSELSGMTMVDADASVYTYSTSGLPTISIYNVTDSVDMLSTPITINVSGYNSYVASTQPVIISGAVITGDRVRIDVDSAGTNTKGLDVILSFEFI